MCDAKRLEAIDLLRGILVICVVLGHAIQQYGGGLEPFWRSLNRIIYSFHMPAFVAVSGLCAMRMLSLSGVSEKLDFIRSRAVRLLVPYFTWGLLYFGLRFVAGDVARIRYRADSAWLFLFGYNPDGAMWFLWALFAATALAVPCARLFTRGLRMALLGIALLAVLCLMPHFPARYRAIYVVPLYWFFIGLGLYLRRVLERREQAAAFWIWETGVALAAFVLATLCWRGRLAPHFPWYAVTAVTASVGLLGFSVLLSRLGGRWTQVLSFLGIEAMTVYVLGEPIKVGCRLLFRAMGLPKGLAFSLTFVLMFLLPLLLVRLIRRSRLASLLLLGERRR